MAHKGENRENKRPPHINNWLTMMHTHDIFFPFPQRVLWCFISDVVLAGRQRDIPRHIHLLYRRHRVEMNIFARDITIRLEMTTSHFQYLLVFFPPKPT